MVVDGWATSQYSPARATRPAITDVARVSRTEASVPTGSALYEPRAHGSVSHRDTRLRSGLGVAWGFTLGGGATASALVATPATTPAAERAAAVSTARRERGFDELVTQFQGGVHREASTDRRRAHVSVVDGRTGSQHTQAHAGRGVSPHQVAVVGNHNLDDVPV